MTPNIELTAVAKEVNCKRIVPIKLPVLIFAAVA
jgi:hypothetical protein